MAIVYNRLGKSLSLVWTPVFKSTGSGAIVAACLFLVSLSPSWGDEDPTSVVVPYSSTGNRVLGDGVNIAFPYTALGRCVSYADKGDDKEDVGWETEGAITSDGKIRISTVADEEKKTTDLSLGFQTTAKINASVFNANSDFDVGSSTETFRSDASKTITLEYFAEADYGKHSIKNYTRDKDAPSPTGDILQFRQICGSHFLRGQHRESSLSVLIRINTSSQQGKDALTAHLNQTLGGGVSLKAISGEAGDKLISTYKSIIEFARSSGTVSVDYRAKGGPGIEAAGEAAKATDPADFTKLSQIASSVSQLFTQKNSGITGYILQANTALGAPPVNFDLDRVQQIGVLTRGLVRLGEAAKRYDSLKSQHLDEYTKYFQTYGDQVTLLRSQLIDKINSCAAGGNCTPSEGDVLKGLVYLEDIFAEAKVSLSCQYQSASNLLPTISTPLHDPEIWKVCL
jgi:hypothetical protein